MKSLKVQNGFNSTKQINDDPDVSRDNDDWFKIK